eukprot:142636-Chlamydomonas_euryale.AAC.1
MGSGRITQIRSRSRSKPAGSLLDASTEKAPRQYPPESRTAGRTSASPPKSLTVRAGTRPAAAPSAAACRGCRGCRQTRRPAAAEAAGAKRHDLQTSQSASARRQGLVACMGNHAAHMALASAWLWRL